MMVVREAESIASEGSDFEAMAEQLEKQGIAASVDGESEESVRFFSEALDHAPSNPRLYVYRAAEYIKLANFLEAIVDADRAINLDPQFWKAYYRKGVALHKLKEYEKAKASFEAGAAINPTYSKFKTLIALCDSKANADGRKGSVNGASLNVQHTSEDVVSSESSALGPKASENSSTDDATSMVPVPLAPVVQAHAQPMFRHSHYQGAGYVSLTVFAKGLSREDVHVDFGEQTLSVVIRTEDKNPYTLQLRLFGKIVANQCKVSVGSTKVDIYLAKADNTNWKQLECPPQLPTQPSADPKVQYPSSSKKGPKDWDKLESEVKKQEKDEKLEGDAALNKLFRDIYSGADEDTRRAMNKSYVESNGTVLSTNWKEVGSKKVVSSPPQGMESKKWEA